MLKTKKKLENIFQEFWKWNDHSKLLKTLRLYCVNESKVQLMLQDMSDEIFKNPFVESSLHQTKDYSAEELRLVPDFKGMSSQYELRSSLSSLIIGSGLHDEAPLDSWIFYTTIILFSPSAL